MEHEGCEHLRSPARAIDLSDLPPTWLDVGTAELFTDEVCCVRIEDVGLWRSGLAPLIARSLAYI
jgi:hypothetical protein